MDNLGKYVYAEQKRQEGTGYMKQQTVYLKCDRSAEVQAQDVFLKDVAEIRCQDPVLQAKLKAIKIYHFPKDGEKRCVISCLKLVSLMEEICPEIDVQVVGETDVLVEWICVNRHKGWQQWIKAAFVCLISFSVQPIRSWLTIMMWGSMRFSRKCTGWPWVLNPEA